MDTDLFYLVWRNHFLRKRIRNLIVGNREIKVALSYLNANHQYLSLLDTGHHNIQIKYSIQQKQAFDDYLENPHRHLITQIDFLSFDLTKAITSTDNQQQLPETLKVITFSIIDDIIFNFDHIPRSVEKLELFFCRKVSYLGQIPENIKHLKIDMIDSNKPSENLSLEDLFLEQLVNYKKLEFLKLYGLSLSRPLIIPPWLKDLNLAKMNNIDQYLVISDPSTTRVKFIKEIESKEQLEAINTSQPWCHSLLLSGLPFKLSPGLIPAHITNIDVNGNLSLEKGCLPEGLKNLDLFFWSLLFLVFFH
ncbi:hypothetical protein CYY_005230 [Polysphondylium violaceum]|uniref:FNIP repeat-containing protein n=1 Tax=Polysphondylium violaceum TaxID=133409 RepID=A0A8J4PUK9_9MYCE|nr:hypothetical protein CYY_005230 [Polysphondylium violaceum]